MALERRRQIVRSTVNGSNKEDIPYLIPTSADVGMDYGLSF